MTVATDDADGDCPHGIPNGWCSLCIGRTDRARRAPTVDPKIITARHETHCHLCTQPIWPGDQAAWWPNKEHRTVHSDCHDRAMKEAT